MTERIFLLLLIPYAALLIWGIRKLGLSTVSIIGLGLTTVAVVWFILYASFSLAVFPQDAAEAFASAEHITRDVRPAWLMRYPAENFGWLLGLAFFCICWCAARLIPRRNFVPE